MEKSSRWSAQSGQSSLVSDKQTVQWTFAANSLRQQDSCVARFEQLAGVFASCGALHYANILARLKYTSPVADGLAVSLATCSLLAKF